MKVELPGDAAALTCDGMRAALKEMSRVMADIAEHKEALIREALTGSCPMRGCAGRVRTARWVVDMGELPMTERLVLMCDAGHEWYQRIRTEVGEGKVALRSTRYAVPFEAPLFRALEAAVEASVPGALAREDGDGGV